MQKNDELIKQYAKHLEDIKQWQSASPLPSTTTKTIFSALPEVPMYSDQTVEDYLIQAIKKMDEQELTKFQQTCRAHQLPDKCAPVEAAKSRLGILNDVKYDLKRAGTMQVEEDVMNAKRRNQEISGQGGDVQLSIEQLKNEVKRCQEALKEAQESKGISRSTAFNKQKAISLATNDLKKANKALRDERNKTPGGRIENVKEELARLEEQNNRLQQAFCGLGRIFNKGAIKETQLSIENLESIISPVKFYANHATLERNVIAYDGSASIENLKNLGMQK